MAVIVPGIITLEQHVQQLSEDAEVYRPRRCPHCGKSGVWCHGRYGRKADRCAESGGGLNPVWIPRFFCGHCRRSCSSLPECLAPRRWYRWSIQQVVLWAICLGASVRQAARAGGVSRRTARRWRGWLIEAQALHRSGLCARFADLGRYPAWRDFWNRCFQSLGLAQAMRWLHQDGFLVP